MIEYYWKLRRSVLLYDVPEKPLEIKGPDAANLCERIFTSRVDTLKIWRARYGIACTSEGMVLMDVKVTDPHSRVLQIQGPKSLDVLRAAADEQVPEGFGYFHAGMFYRH